MKILHVYPDYDHMGSLERRILLLCEQCQALPDIELIVACTEGGQLQYALERQGIATIGLYSPDCFKNPHLRALDLKSYWQAKQIADNIQPDLVHVHTGGAENLIWRLLGLPTVLTLHGYSSLSSMVAPLSPIKRSVDALFRTLFCWSARWMNGITCVSWAEAERLSEEGYIPDDKPVHIIPNGLPMLTFQGTIAKNRFLYDPTHLMPDYTPGDPVIAWIGRLEPDKQPDLFLALARQLSASFPKAWWLLIGEGSLKAALEEHVHSEPIPRLLMPGFLPADSVLAFSSVLVHTPKTAGFGMVVLQAMAAGVPVASLPVGGVCDLLEKMPECLTPSSSLLDLATTVRALLSLNAEARVQLSAAMIRHASQHYDADKLLLQWLGLYEQMLEGVS